MNQTIRFSTNWNNKLNNKAFSTIRIHNPKKYIIGNAYNIELNGISKGIATLHEKRILSIDKLNNFICYLDTGYSKAQTIGILQKMYKNLNLKNVLFDFCLLVYNQQSETQPVQSKLNL